ncbi:MAG: NUDIX domain-containing protein [Candidatus Microsaccharimonas sp.]
MNTQLFEATRRVITSGEVYRGYPTTRLTLDKDSFSSDTLPELPNGPWTMNNTPLPTVEESKKFLDAGYKIDSDGRPLHPWINSMITDPEVGMVTGKGTYYFWGPNYTADPIVITSEAVPRVLLIQRSDTPLGPDGKPVEPVWAIPGGFVDDGEDPEDSARRELGEETGRNITEPATLLYRGVVADLRTTANSWAETSAYTFVVDKPFPVVAGDDADDACWFTEEELAGIKMHGSHEVLVRMAFHPEGDTTIRDILALPKESLETTVIDAGHMAYDHRYVSDGSTRLFVKAHDASRFTDPEREKHSRRYLRKEFFLFGHAAKQGFTAIPKRVDLIDDSILAMDAFHPDDGYLWDAPYDERFKQYCEDIIAKLDHLQSIEAPVNPEYHEDIKDTYTTFWEEGWDAIDNASMTAITDKIHLLSANWTNDQKSLASDLANFLPQLRGTASQLDRDVPLYMAHNDARQSNIAWHPDQGVKLVDWSWGDVAPKDADITMFLIDLAKSGHDVSKYADRINRDQALVYLGFLVAHSIWETRDGSQTVREHQVAAAAAAFSLIR